MHLSMVHSAQRHPRRACAPTVLRRWMPDSDGPRRQPSHRSVPAVSLLRRHFNSITLTMNIAIGAPRPLRAVSVQRPTTTMRPSAFLGTMQLSSVSPSLGVSNGTEMNVTAVRFGGGIDGMVAAGEQYPNSYQAAWLESQPTLLRLTATRSLVSIHTDRCAMA